ncbi:uncharacterized protein LOC108824488 [Raphanus sativus]|uniref:Uncharacterized protein LOC108824488 n=1 Tax=Raphanus sativus TaxID=3726 RepID=A0A6J0KZU0_RAPSA|nr:uncharacterized protein LOC108824488 [Raphanus sativus]
MAFEDKLTAIIQQVPTLPDHLRHLPWWILWRIWKCRNKMLFQNQTIHWRSTLQAAYFDTKEWLEAYQFLDTDNNRRSQNRNVETQQHKWIRPPSGYTKCNYDGAFSNTERGAKAGWIIRDDMGIFKGAANATIRYPKTALEGELQALLFAIMNCWSKGHHKILFEGDNITVLKLIKGETINIDVTNWIKDIR